MPQISFDESAKAVAMRYRWPGNVRQLKNVTEQLALFYAGDNISDTVLESFLPQSGTVYTPAVASASASHEYARERELLFNMIFRMQSEIDALRSEIRASSHAPAEAAMPTSLVKYAPPATGLIVSSQPVEAQPATLEETEKETIRRSLENNGGKRKATAKELNISERTLYRKIKEYGLE